MAYDNKAAGFSNENRGSLFVNDKKEQDNHPDFRGSLDVGGTEYWLSAWKKTSKDGKKFLSLSIKLKEDRQSDQPTRKAPAKQEASDDLSW